MARAFVALLVCTGVAWADEVPALSADEARRQLAAISVDVSVERLIQYAAEGDTATVELLLAAGVSAKAADPVRRVTPLHNAAAQGHARLVSRFIELDANVDAQDWTGATPLVNAAYHGRAAVVDQLLERSARTDIVPAQAPTALIAAIQSGSLPVVERLLGAEADPKLADAAGQTPLAAAELAGRSEIAARLRDAIARASAK